MLTGLFFVLFVAAVLWHRFNPIVIEKKVRPQYRKKANQIPDGYISIDEAMASEDRVVLNTVKVCNEAHRLGLEVMVVDGNIVAGKYIGKLFGVTHYVENGELLPAYPSLGTEQVPQRQPEPVRRIVSQEPPPATFYRDEDAPAWAN